MQAPDQKTMELVAQLEVDMMTDLYKRMTSACQSKCMTRKYGEPSLSKAESVCLDRCVAKYLEVHEKLGKQLTQMSAKDEAAIQKPQANPT